MNRLEYDSGRLLEKGHCALLFNANTIQFLCTQYEYIL